MQWFVVGYMVTVFWGNGSIEEARTVWSDVVLGTTVECQAVAESLRKYRQDSFEKDKDYMSRATVKHLQNPARWNGGIKEFRVATAFCAPFASHEAIKSAFPERWDMMAGSRSTGHGGSEAFRWWDGEKGAVIK